MVDSQVTHGIGMTWAMTRDFAHFSSTFEIQNLTNARVYDYFGAQRPGRSLQLKVAIEL